MCLILCRGQRQSGPPSVPQRPSCFPGRCPISASRASRRLSPQKTNSIGTRTTPQRLVCFDLNCTHMNSPQSSNDRVLGVHKTPIAAPTKDPCVCVVRGSVRLLAHYLHLDVREPPRSTWQPAVTLVDSLPGLLKRPIREGRMRSVMAQSARRLATALPSSDQAEPSKTIQDR